VLAEVDHRRTHCEFGHGAELVFAMDVRHPRSLICQTAARI
jgi:hypothetical protein